MKTVLSTIVSLLLLASVVAAGEWANVPSEIELMQARTAYEVSRYQECEPEAPKNAFVIIPQFFNSSNSRSFINFDGQQLRVEKSHANGAGVTALYNRKFSDFISVAFMYEHGFLNISGGWIGPAALSSKTKQRWNSHVVGILPEFNFDKWGKVQLSLIQGFDRASGNTRLSDGTVLSHEDDGSNVTSLMAWYEKDFQLGCSNWKLSPYAGWRSLYVVVRSANPDNNLWVHLLSGGLKLGYQSGKFGFNIRGGVNYRTTKADVPSYGNRAVAPGVVHFSHRANLDRTVGTAGVGVSYAINPRAIMAVGYDGAYGSDTTAHMASLNFIFPF